MTNWKRNIALYFWFFKIRLHIYAEYRSDAVLLAGSSALSDGMGLLFIHVIYQQAPNINGWPAAKLVLIYGVMTIAAGTTQLFFDGIWTTSDAIYRGRFDIYLTRPISPFLSVLTSWMSPEGIGSVVLGVALCAGALWQTEISWSFAHGLIATCLVIAGLALRAGLTLLANCICFWVNSPFETGDMAEPLYELGRYPLSIYSSAIRVGLTIAFPIAFIAYFPVNYLTQAEEMAWVALMGPVCAAIVWVLALRLFRLGVRSYSSSGN
ncbi:ABC transporter permease [Nonomuraea sp. NPDC049714]|uniref:ABC transporter permease n=1 Tax=Nonomuraea sp. NPDC049714 TaxID=3364357 RepID=UPI0037B452B4